MDSKSDAARVLQLGVIFLFFFELLTEMMTAIYNLNLLQVELNENALGVAFLLSPVALVFCRRGQMPKFLVLIAGVGVIACRIAVPFLPVTGVMIAGGIGVGCAMIYLPAILVSMGGDDHAGQKGQALATSLALGVGVYILARTINSSLDGIMYGSFQWVGWVLGAIVGILIISQSLGKNVPEGPIERTAPVINSALTAPTPPTASAAPPISPAVLPKTRFRKRLTLVAGFIGIFLLVYIAFTSPSVLARWVDADYIAVVSVLLGTVTVSIGVLVAVPSVVNKISGKMFKIWNAAFVASLVLTIVANMALDQSIQPLGIIVLQQIPLYATLGFLPILFVDFAVVSRELIKCKPTLPQLGTTFTVGGAYVILAIFGAVFTIVWDYIPVIGSLFKDMFWAIILITGIGATLPVLLIQRGSLLFVAPSRPKIRRVVALLLVGGIAGGGILSAVSLNPTPVITGGKTTLKVLTYNIQQGADAYGNRNFDGVLKLLQEQDVDILALQESDTQRISSGNNDITRYLAQNLNVYSYFAPKTVTGTFGLSLLSRFPITDAQAFYMPSEGEQTATIQAKITVSGRTFNVFVTHLGNGGLEYLPILTRTSPLSDVLLMGDFNFKNGSTQYNAVTATGLQSAWALTWPTGQDDNGYWGFTSNALDPKSIIDHIFVSPSVTVTNCRVLTGTTFSDHLAVFAEITI